MNSVEKVEKTLSGRKFGYKDNKYRFLSAKRVNSYVMIGTDVKTLQIDCAAIDDFLDEVEILPAVEIGSTPASPPKRSVTVYDVPDTFRKLSAGFDKLLDELEAAAPDDLDKLKKKAEMLTSIGATAVAMETTKINAAKVLNNL